MAITSGQVLPRSPRPAWFAPGDPSAYDVWAEPQSNNGVLLRHKVTKEMFVAACQL